MSLILPRKKDSLPDVIWIRENKHNKKLIHDGKVFRNKKDTFSVIEIEQDRHINGKQKTIKNTLLKRRHDGRFFRAFINLPQQTHQKMTIKPLIDLFK